MAFCWSFHCFLDTIYRYKKTEMKRPILFSLLFAVAAAILMAGCSDDDDNNPASGKTYVIVPGAWSAPYAWQNLKNQLESQGQRVVVVQLPGHGADTTSFARLHLDSYVDKVIQTIDSLNTRVVLVGHSLAGMVITEVAEKVPSKIEKMIYVAAFLPANGQSLFDLANTDPTSLLGQNFTTPDGYVTLEVPREKITDIFIQDGSSAVKSLVLNNYKAEPGLPFLDSATITSANFGSVSKFYIHTIQDHAVTYDLQQRMVAAAGVKNVYWMNTSHSPFLASPDSLTILLQKIVQ
jgi:pimeloyl-ACP methyl ester carboxylesterase